MTTATPESIAVDIAAMQEQIKAIALTVTEIRSAVSQIMAIDRSIAQLTIHVEQTRDSLLSHDKQIENSRKWQDAHEKEIVGHMREMTDQIGKVDAKVEAVVNRGRGALWVIGILFTLSQAFVLSAGAWVFNNVNQNTSSNNVIEYRLKQVEEKLKQTH